MKRTELIPLILWVCFFLAPAVVSAQVLNDGQPSVLKDDQNPPNYVYDLKLLIKKSRENIKNVDLKIKEQAVTKRNQKREEKAQEYYLEAMKLQEEGRLEEARQLFEKAIRITDHPEMQGYIKESEHRAKSQESALKKEEDDQERRLTEEEKLALQKIDDEYQIAVSLYRQQKFQEAKTAFEAVEQMAPDYKAVRSYLQIIGQDIAQQDNLAIKEQKKEIERQQAEVEVARLREKELWRKEIEKKEESRKNQLKKQAEEAYNEALKLYQDKKYPAAKVKFQEVDWVVPDFKATRAYLGRIDQDIENDKKRVMSEHEKELEKQRWEETLAQRKAEAEREKALQAKERERLAQIKDQAEFIYGAAVALFDKNSYAQAKEKFDEVESIFPNYKSTRGYLKKVEQLLGLPVSQFQNTDLPPTIAGKSPEEQKQAFEEEAARKKEEQENIRKISTETEDAFNEAMVLFNTGHLIEAKEKFISVDQKIPDYKSTRSYLKRIDDDIELLAKTHKREQTFLDQKAEVEKLRALKEKADAIYSAALAAYDVKDFVRAKAGFLDVEMTLPDFKKTKFYLQHIEDEIERQKAEVKRQEIESQANVAYAQAAVLYKTGQFEEAKNKFIEVEAILPNYKDINNYLEHIDDDIIAKKEKDLIHLKELQVEGPYAEAVILYQNQDYKAAKVKFLEVMAVYPDYKDTTQFLNKIDDDIEKQSKQTELRERTEQAETLYKQAVELYQAGDFASAKEKFVKLEVVWPDYKESPRYLGRIDGDIALKKQKEEVARRSSEAEPVYDQALALYKEQEFLEAKKKFMQVQVMYPGFRDAALYLSRIDKDIQSQEERVARLEQLRKADELYTVAVNLYAEHKFEEAKQKLLETAGVDPNYKYLRSYLSRIDEDIRLDAALQDRKSKEQKAEEPYAQAVVFYHDRKFDSAKEKFLETARIHPDYKKVRSYLSRIDQDIREEKRKAVQDRIEKAVALYREAQALVADKKLTEALNKLSELEVLYPDYKNTRTLMADIKVRLANKEMAAMTQSSEMAKKPNGLATQPLDSTPDDTILSWYKEAVSLFKAKNYPEAKIRFSKIAAAQPNFRSTEKYLQSIEEILGTHKKPESPKPVVSLAIAVKAQPPAHKVPDPPPTPTVKNQPMPPPVANEAEALAAKTASLYQEAVQLYKAGKYDEARAKFEHIESSSPNYKSTRQYISLAGKAREQAAQPAVSQAQSEKEVASLRALSQRSEAIYRQIKSLAQDKDMSSALQTFSQVDRIINNLEAEQKRMQALVEDQQRREREELIRQKKAEKTAELLNTRKVQAQQELLKQAEEKKLADEEQVRLLDVKTQEKEKEKREQKALENRIETVYQKALEAVQNKKYAEAREAFSEIEAVRPNYKDCVQILNRMDREEGEAKLVEHEDNDRKAVADLVERANVINLEIIQLTKARNYEVVHQKFDELSGILQEIQKIKDRVLARRQEFTTLWEKRMAKAKVSGLASQRSPEKLVSDLDSGIAASQARSLLREGERLYAAQKYAEAKAKFVEASSLDPNLKAAVTYLNRVKRVQEQKDFEARREHDQRQVRALERKEEVKEASSEDNPKTDGKQLSEEERSKLLLQQGTEFYRGHRYRESRIKFEELAQIGDEKQRGQAKRYLVMIEKNMQKDKAEAYKKRQAEQERYLSERRLQGRLSRSHNMPPAAGSEQPLTRGERELEIKYQQELRLIEQKNRAERVQNSSVSQRQDGTVQAAEKVDKSIAPQGMVKGNKPVRPTDAADNSERKESLSEPAVDTPAAQVATAAPAPSDARKAAEPKTDLGIISVDRPAGSVDSAQRAQIKKEKARPQKKEATHRKESDRERDRIKQEKELAAKSRREAGRGHEVPSAEMPELAEVEKSAGTGSVVASGDLASTTQAQSKTEFPGFKEKTLRMAMEDEKRQLEQQRKAVRRDFEIGVDRLYNESVELFKRHLFSEAQQGFLQVADMIKGYKKTDNYLGQIDRILKINQNNSSVIISESIPHNSQVNTDTSVLKARRSQAISWELDSFEKKAPH